jgi:hypothetical protein
MTDIGYRTIRDYRCDNVRSYTDAIKKDLHFRDYFSEECFHLDCDALKSYRISAMFRRNMFPPSSGSESKTREQPVCASEISINISINYTASFKSEFLLDRSRSYSAPSGETCRRALSRCCSEHAARCSLSQQQCLIMAGVLLYLGLFLL